jgi:hypothetical protein
MFGAYATYKTNIIINLDIQISQGKGLGGVFHLFLIKSGWDLTPRHRIGGIRSLLVLISKHDITFFFLKGLLRMQCAFKIHYNVVYVNETHL